MKRLYSLLVLSLLVSPAFPAGDTIEVIPLQHRTVNELVPVLAPLAGPQGSVTGMHGQLIVRTTPDRLKQIREVLDKLDTAPRRLLISVRQAARSSGRRQVLGANADISIGDEGRVTVGKPPRHSDGDQVTIFGQHRTTDNQRDVTQRLQVMEGRQAFIQVGVSLPIVQRGYVTGRHQGYREEVVGYRDATTGFYVRPRLRGDRVTLEIAPQMDRPGPGGSVAIQHAQTTVSGRLGEWIEIGGMSGANTQSGSRIARTHRTLREEDRVIEVMVEEAS